MTAYEITEGGPLRSLERALRFTRGDRRDWWRCTWFFLLIVYVPVLVFGLGARLATGAWSPSLLSLDTHVRALVSIPLLIAAESLVDTRAREAGTYMLASQILGNAREGYEAAIARTSRLRDSYAVEILLLVVAVATSLMKGAVVGTTSVFHWANEAAIVLVRFLLLRWLWHWLVWGVFLRRVTRLPLALRATDPDRMGGLAPLLEPFYAMFAVVMACAATLAASWAEIMLRDGAPLSSFYGLAITYVGLAVVVVLLPACVLIPPLYLSQKGGLARYGAFAHRYAYAFEQRWFDVGGKEALGAPDISGLADLGGSYSAVSDLRVLPWTHRLVLTLVLGALIPMVPLALINVGLPALLQKIAGQLL